MLFTSPFGESASKPGHGSIIVDILPPGKTVLRKISYQYPLKLVAPGPLAPNLPTPDGSVPCLINTVFILTYGGGIVAGDSICLDVELEKNTRLILLTQGSTKIFKTPTPEITSRQHMTVHVKRNAALVYLPDPVQPFAQSAFAQSQIYELENEQGSLCVCDWVTSGRSARGEKWDIHEYRSRNEVWTTHGTGLKRLLLRDNLILGKNGKTSMHFSSRMDDFLVFGTLILRGPAFSSLADFFLDEFDTLPRIGGRDWDDSAKHKLSDKEHRRIARLVKEKADGLVWSVANVRGFVIVKFACKDVEGSRNWLRVMIVEEGCVVNMFGERAIMCLR